MIVYMVYRDTGEFMKAFTTREKAKSYIDCDRYWDQYTYKIEVLEVD